MVDHLDLVEHGEGPRLGEADFHHVPLGRRNHQRLDHHLPLEARQVGGHQLHVVAGEAEVVGARVGDVGDEEADHLARAKDRLVALLAVDQHDVPEAPHDGEVGRVPPVRQELVAVDEQIVHHDELLAARRAEVVVALGVDHHVAVESPVLLDVLAHMRVVPVEPRVGEDDFVDEGLAGRDRILGDAGYAVEAVVEAEAVPVYGGREIDRVREADHDARVLGDAQQRPGVLPVEAVHDEDAAADPALHDARIEGDGVAVGDVEDFAGCGPRECRGVESLARQEGVHRRADAAQAGEHGVAQHGNDHVARAAHGVHGHVHVHAHGAR